MAIFGSVQITGFIAPTFSGDTYATHDAYYGRDGLRNVDLEVDLHGITSLRRKSGMIVGVSGGTKHYRLLPANSGNTWTFTMADWAVAFLTPEESAASFTGNTSATCINTIYVSNLYGCESLTVHSPFYLTTLGTGTSVNNLGVDVNGNVVPGTSGGGGIGNRWHVPSGTTVNVPNDFQTFIYGDLLVEGIIDLQPDAQLVVLNGDIILSGGSIIGSGTTYNITLPDMDTKVNSLSVSGNTLILTQNDSSTFNVSLPSISSSSFKTTSGFTANITETITHGLNSTDIIVQVRDLTSNELISVSVDNYQLNSVDITSSSTLTSVRIMILAI